LKAQDKLNLVLLGTVIYHVSDPDRAKAWYSEVLGFPPYFDQPFYVGFSVGGFELGLDPVTAPVVAGNNEVAYGGAKDCRSAYQRRLCLGAKVRAEVQDGHGILVASVLDPFGNSFGILRNPHFKLPASE
jgi:catechol 2,3-dioxygenase-like lactoylglutathione lyase family enzyme